MKIWMTLRQGEVYATSKFLVRTADPALVRSALRELYTNRLLEDDREDVILDPGFIASAPALIGALDGAIRREAVRRWPGEGVEGESGCRHPDGSHGQGRPADLRGASVDPGDDPSGGTSNAPPERHPVE